MCGRGHYEVAKKSERAELENALKRTDALAKEWREDGKRIIEAARKYLCTLPLSRKTYAVIADSGTHAVTGEALDYLNWPAADLPHAKLLATQFIESGYTTITIHEMIS